MISFRAATYNDLDLLTYWDTKAHVIAADPNDDWNWAEELRRSPKWREMLIAELDRRPIGFVQIIDPANEESHYWGNVAENLRAIDIWIGEESDLNKGFGTKMMNSALSRCFAKPAVTAVLIDPLASNTAAIRFYKRIGFCFVERRAFGADVCDVYKITRGDFLNKIQ